MVVPSVAIIPVKQHLHRMCTSVVKKDDYVRVGDVIARSDLKGLPPVHSSVSGRIKEIIDYPDPFGRRSECIIVESDGEDRWTDKAIDGELHEIISESGIVETYSMHRPMGGRGADTVIINGTDHRPYVFSDKAIMWEEGKKVVDGLLLMMEAVGAKRGVIGVNASDINFLERMRYEVKAEGIQIVPLKMFYTRGMDRLLSRDLSKQMKTDLGRCIISRTQIARAVYEAIVEGKPFVEVYVSVYGAVENGAPKVRIGTTFQEVIQSLGGYRETPKRIFMNSPMTGIAQYTDEVPVVRATYGLTVQYETPEEEPGPCIRCAQCVDACPVNLLPNLLALYSRKNKFSECRNYHVFACIECGYCSYSCPSKIPIMQLIRYAKSNLEGKA